MNRFMMVGVFVVAGLALFTTGLFMIGNRHEAFARHVEVYIEFADVSGIVTAARRISLASKRHLTPGRTKNGRTQR